MRNIFRHRRPTCPYCELDWKDGETFRAIDRECIFRQHGFEPNKYEKTTLYNMLSLNSYSPELSYISDNHFIILLRRTDNV